jgi:hypothetical protein
MSGNEFERQRRIRSLPGNEEFNQQLETLRVKVRSEGRTREDETELRAREKEGLRRREEVEKKLDRR